MSAMARSARHRRSPLKVGLGDRAFEASIKQSFFFIFKLFP
jgi:hypothetical protein